MASVYYGNDNVASGLIYTPMSEGLSRFISSANERALERLGDIGRRFADRAANLYRRSGFDTLVDLRDHVDRMRKRAVKDYDDIRVVESLEDIVEATPKMRRWMMANPMIRKGVREKTLSGWDNEVEDDLQFSPEEHPDYKYIVNGEILDDQFVEFIDSFVDEIRDTEKLTDGERFDIRLGWEFAEHALANKYDPTSKWGAMLE